MIKPTADMDPMYLYDQFIKDDEWSENDNDTERQFGTSVRAGAKHLQKTGRVKSYLWAEGVEDVRAWHLSNFGTVVLGVNWYTGMFEPDSEGYIKVSGIVEGGHCVKTTGWNDTARPGGVVYGQNSWDEDWGVKGRFRIRRDDLERLIMEQGEACAAVEQKVVPV
jgi:hypothetical protein